MKKNAIKTTLISIISLYFISHVFSQAPAISNQYNTTNEDGTFSVCQIMKQSIDFTSELEPNIKKLKKMIGKVSEDTILDYAIYLHDFLYKKSTVYPFIFNQYRLPEKSDEKHIEIVRNYILPKAKQGNFKAICFLTGRYYWQSSEALNYISSETIKKPVYKYIKYLWGFQQNSNDLKYVNEYVLSLDSTLLSYFKDFNKIELINLRDTIDLKINYILKLQIDYSKEFSSNNEAAILKIIPEPIDLPYFCQSFGIDYASHNGLIRIAPVTFDGIEISFDAIEFLKLLRRSIDFILVNDYAKSLSQILFDYNDGVNKYNVFPAKKYRESFKNYYLKDAQYFANDKKLGPLIFKQLSATIPFDTSFASLGLKSDLLNRSAELGDKDAFFNIACLYQTTYYNTKNTKYSDSCIYYLEKLLPLNYPEAIALKGIKLFNGESYIKNKEEGVKLLIKAKDIGSPTAKILLETLPTKLFPNYVEGAFFQQEIKISDPWDFKVRCSNGCGKMTYPKEIIFGRIYDDNPGLPQIKKAKFFLDDTGNPIINITENDFRRTFVLAQLLNPYRKHVMCSETCQKEHEKKNNSNWDEVLNKRKAIDNEEIKCSACINVKKRKEMISITECPCYTESGNPINLSYTQSYDLYGDKEPKVCSSRCKIEFCKTKCAVKGYTSKY